jgi:hypothetical protein
MSEPPRAREEIFRSLLPISAREPQELLLLIENRLDRMTTMDRVRSFMRRAARVRPLGDVGRCR